MSKQSYALSSLSSLAALTFLLVLPLHVHVAAQETESEVPARETTAESEATEAAQASGHRAALQPTDAVTYEQVLADPDNVELNFRYARAQVARGDLRGASATLERILMTDPSLAQARLFHAIVLLRLDSLQDASRELTLIRGLEIGRAHV